jgi:hypothetical protein
MKELIREELIRKKVKEDKIEKYISEVLFLMELDIPRLVEVTIKSEYKNRGTLKKGWIVKYDWKDDLYEVVLVNESRARIVNMTNSSDTADIAPNAEVIVLDKPEEFIEEQIVVPDSSSEEPEILNDDTGW